MPRFGHADSSFLSECLMRVRALDGGLALDLPSGSGRHITLLQAAGFDVVAADLDVELLAHVSHTSPGALRLVVDASKELPFALGSFDLVISVHPVVRTFLKAIPRLLRPGGHFLFETFGAQGENARELPRPGEVATAVYPLCEPVRYLERPTRSMPNRVTVKALFRRQFDQFP